MIDPRYRNLKMNIQPEAQGVPARPRGAFGGPPKRNWGRKAVLAMKAIAELDPRYRGGFAQQQAQFDAQDQRALQAQKEAERQAAMEEITKSLPPGMAPFMKAAPNEVMGGLIDQKLAPPQERKIVEGADGHKYYADNRQRVLPGVQAPGPSADWQETVIQTENGPVKKLYDANSADPMSTLRDIGAAPVKTPLVTVNNPTVKGETSFQTERGKSASGRMDSVMAAGEAANQTLADAQMMNTLIDQIDYTGFGSEALLNVQKLGRMVGLDIGDDVPAKEAATRLTAKLGLALKENLPGPMSDGDREFLLSIPPNILTTREGNKALVFMMMKRAQFDRAMQQSLLRANPQSKADFEAWENEFKLTHGSMFDDASRRDLLNALGVSGT